MPKDLKDRVKEAMEKGESIELTDEDKEQIQEEYSRRVEKKLEDIKKDQLFVASSRFHFVSG